MIQTTSSCSLCNGTYWIITEDGVAKRCKCFESEKQKRRLRFANIPETYKDVTLGNFDKTVYKLAESRNSIQTAVELINVYIEDFIEYHEAGKGLYLWSQEKGSGKTRMAASIANELLKVQQVKFATSMAILNEIRASWDKSKEYSESQLLDDLVNTDILVIDDFGTEQVKDWINEKFYHIINERYINRKVTIYTSNSEVEKLQYDRRIIDRVREKVYQVHFPEESVRERIAKVNQILMNRKIGGNNCG